MSLESDSAFTDRLADGLDETFPELVDRYGAMVLTLATRLTDASTGQDITQDVFLRSYRALAGYARDRIMTMELRPWLATITRNLVRNEYRRRERRPTVPLGNSASAVPAGVDVGVEAVESHDRFAALLSPLSELQREAVVLRHVIGLPVREVALTMACPEGTAKSHVARGLDRLRVQLNGTTGLEGDLL